MPKTYFGNGTILTPDVINGLQNPSFVSKSGYPNGTSQLDLNNGEVFIPDIDLENDLTTTETSLSKSLFPDGTGKVIFREIWGGAIEPPLLGVIGVIGIPVTVKAGSILNSYGAEVTWNDTIIEIPFNSTQFIYINDSGGINLSLFELSRAVPHTTLASITVSANAVLTLKDLRPHTFVGTHNDTPQSLVNTVTVTADYQSKSYERIIIDTSGGSISVALPIAPLDGDRVALVDLIGGFNSNPVVLSPYRINGVAQYTISDSNDDWLFNANYTYVQLVYIAISNTWVFEAIPDSTCKNRGVFAKCGGSVSSLTTQASCESKGYIWTAGVSQCFREQSTGLYSDGNGDFIEIINDDRCELQLSESKGNFLRCNGVNAVYTKADGTTASNSATYIEVNAARCGGQVKGRFLRCESSSDGLQQAVYENTTSGTYTIKGDDRCSILNYGRFIKCLEPGIAGFGDSTVRVGVYEKTTPIPTGNSYLFDDPVCRSPSVNDKGRFLRCNGTSGIYQASADGSVYNTVEFDSRCYISDRTADIKMSMKQISHGPWLLCNGSNIPAQYTDLIAEIGTKVPDFRDRSPIGGVSPSDVMIKKGNATHTMTVAQLPTHNHTLTINDHLHTLNIPNHTHSATQALHDHAINIPSHNHTFNAGNHSHGFVGSSHTHTAISDDHSHALSLPAHKHTVPIADHTHGMRNHTHMGGAHSHTLFAWYDTSDPNNFGVDSPNSDDNVDNFGANRPTAVAGEANGPQAYITTNITGTNLVGNVGSVVSTGVPSNNTTDPVNEIGNTTDTTFAGNSTQITSVNLGLAVSVASAVANGTIANANISGVTANSGAVTNELTTQKAPTITVASAALTGTTSNSSLTGIIGNTGSADAFSLLSPVITTNFFIHV